MNTHSELAYQLFLDGYNCAQAVFCAFEDVTGIERQTGAALASSFGGGLGRMREVCGAVSGGAMVLGILKGYSNPKDSEAKKAHYQLVRDFAGKFKAENGSFICRELLSGVSVTPGGNPEERTAQYYRKRPCPQLVRQAAEILDEMLTESA